MWLYEINTFLGGYSIAISVAIALWRISKMSSLYYPFVYLLLIALANEILSDVFIALYGSNDLNNSIYGEVELLVMIYMFYTWGTHHRQRRFYMGMAIAGVLLWAIARALQSVYPHIGSAFEIGRDYMIIFLSVDQLNYILLTERKKLITNPQFLICSALVIGYTYNAFVEIFFLINMGYSTEFYGYLLLILNFMNLFANIIYAIAALWIPTRQKFTLPYSFQ